MNLKNNILDWQNKGKELLVRPHEVDYLLSGILGISRTELYLKGESILNEEKAHSIYQAFQKRLSGMPLQYILGETEFFSLPFYVKPGVFIPRPETELLVEEALRLVKFFKPCRILDLCTGCGNIALSLAKNTMCDIIACDISEISLETAGENARRLNLAGRVKFLKGDIFEPLKNEVYPKISIIVSNPPYISRDEWGTLPEEIKYYEPREALYGGDNGLDFYRRISDEARYFITKGGYLLVEAGPAHDVASLLKDHGWQDIMIIKDYKNYERVIICKWTK